VFALHVTSPEEVEPAAGEEVLMVDAEIGGATQLRLTPEVVRAYRETFQAYCAEIEGFCRTHGWGYLRSVTNAPFEELMLKALREQGLLR